MKIFLELDELSEIEEAESLGLVDGLIMSTALLTRSGKGAKGLITEIKSLLDVPLPLCWELAGPTARELITQGEGLALAYDHLVVTFPLTSEEGLKALKHFSSRGISTYATSCFSTAQALLAARGKATYISLFSPSLALTSLLSRSPHSIKEEARLLRDVVLVFGQYQFATQVITGPVRSSDHFLEASRHGSNVICAPLPVIKQLITHPLTSLGSAKFWEGSGREKERRLSDRI